MQFSMMCYPMSGRFQAQVLGSYILLWSRYARDNSVDKVYLIAWKQGSITLVSVVIHDSPSCIHGDNGNDSSGNVPNGNMEPSI